MSTQERLTAKAKAARIMAMNKSFAFRLNALLWLGTDKGRVWE